MGNKFAELVPFVTSPGNFCSVLHTDGCGESPYLKEAPSTLLYGGLLCNFVQTFPGNGTLNDHERLLRGKADPVLSRSALTQFVHAREL